MIDSVHTSLIGQQVGDNGTSTLDNITFTDEGMVTVRVRVGLWLVPA